VARASRHAAASRLARTLGIAKYSPRNMDPKTLLDSVAEDLAMHHKRGQTLLGYVGAVLLAAVLLSFMYLGPGIAARALPSQEADLATAHQEYERKAQAFERKHGKRPYSVDEKEYKSAKERGTLSPEVEESRALVEQRPSGTFVGILRFISALRADDDKLEGVAKLFPYLLGGAFAGLLLAYRVHVVAARDITMRKLGALTGSVASSTTSAKAEPGKQSDA
jgi:hypothetical protein